MSRRPNIKKAAAVWIAAAFLSAIAAALYSAAGMPWPAAIAAVVAFITAARAGVLAAAASEENR